MGRRWWMTGAFDVVRSEVSIVVFDQGVGIPSTLEPELLDWIEAIRNANGWGLTDGLMIEAATRPGRTSTDQPGRGRGFSTMRKFVDACDEGELLVYSNRGHYMYGRSGDRRGDSDQSLGGTLVQWRVRHSSSLMRLRS